MTLQMLNNKSKFINKTRVFGEENPALIDYIAHTPSINRATTYAAQNLHLKVCIWRGVAFAVLAKSRIRVDPTSRNDRIPI